MLSPTHDLCDCRARPQQRHGAADHLLRRLGQSNVATARVQPAPGTCDTPMLPRPSAALLLSRHRKHRAPCLACLYCRCHICCTRTSARCCGSSACSAEPLRFTTLMPNTTDYLSISAVTPCDALTPHTAACPIHLATTTHPVPHLHPTRRPLPFIPPYFATPAPRYRHRGSRQGRDGP